MSEADDKRLAIIRNAVENTGYVNCEPDRAFLLRLLDAAREEIARLGREREIGRNCYRNAWNALRMIREAVEAHMPSGALPSGEGVIQERGPEAVHEAEAIVEAIVATATRAESALAEAREDAARWRMLPAVLERHQIDFVSLKSDIDAALTPPSPDGSET